MSQKSRDKETYSVDEMMERLREGEREKEAEGELVTREDGTQVMRVKKRKRRTKQKKEEAAKRRKRMVMVKTLALVTIPLVLGLGVLFLLAKYHSPSFAKSVRATVWERTGGVAQIKGLSPKGNQVTAQSIRLNWPDGRAIENLQAQNLVGDLSLISFVTGRLRGEELKASKGQLLASGREDRKITAPKDSPAPLPGFKKYRCDDFSFFFGRSNAPFRLEGTRVEFSATDYSKQLSLTGGNLTALSWGKVPFKRGTLEFLNNTLKVVSLRFEENNRHVILSGTLDFADSIHSLTVEVVNGDLGNVGGSGLQNLLVSEIDGATGTLVFRPWSVESHEVTLSATPDYLTVQNFAFLRVLEDLYGDASYKDFEFEVENNFEVLRSARGVEVRDLDLLELGVLAVKGLVKVEGGSLGGEIQIGLPDHKRVTLRDSQRKAFFEQGRLEDGFFWFDVKLSGTPEAPNDDFSRYLRGGAAVESAGDLFEQLTQ